MALSLFETIANATNAALRVILETEGRAVPDFVVGRIRNSPHGTEKTQEFQENDKAIRVRWLQDGGRFDKQKTPTDISNPATEPPMAPIMIRRANARIDIWHVTAEHAEHILDRLVLATRQLTTPPTAFELLFMWDQARYEYPSQMAGQPLQSGVHVINLIVPIDLPVASRPDGSMFQVENQGFEFRAGIENPAGEPMAESEYDVDRLTTAWPG